MLRLCCLLMFLSLMSCLKPKGSPLQNLETASDVPVEIPTIPEPSVPDMFEREFTQLKLLPLDIRELKFEQWLSDPSQASLAKSNAEANLDELGGPNYAEGRPESRTWGKPYIEQWLKHVAPFCQDSRAFERFAAGGTSELFVSIYGRLPTTAEVEDFSQVDAEANLSAQDKFVVKCLSLVSSLEFVSQ